MATPKIKQVLLDFEDKGKFGINPATPKPYQISVNENGIVANMQTKTDNVIGGDIDSGGELYKTYDEVGGSIKMPLYYEQLGVILKAALGEPHTEDLTSSKPGFFKHTFKSTECIPSVVVQDLLSVQCNKSGTDKDLIKKFNGLRVNTLSISASPDSDYDVEINFIGATGEDNLSNQSMQKLDDSSKVVLDSTRMKNDHVKLYVGDDGNFYKLAKEFNLSLDRGTEAIRVLSAGAMVEDSKFDLTGQLSSIFDGEFYKKAKNQEQIKVRLVFSDGSNEAEFIIAQAQFAVDDSARSYGGKYPLDMKFNGVKSGSTDAKLKVVLTNKVASY
ncbi:phage tail tube protein [Campylobacter sp. 19-13652]|uniref:phage tail tube protein n=1 Tax=Campylobacter sp. 19-13652 TaxID=2840180 RepID=UPI001C78048F|nr:phage tail tube protein [Campylobacter sp. 19-13652]BCX79283.1 hypothetical protein LBC_07450 [Campylobacter sp. 19-13652]